MSKPHCKHLQNMDRNKAVKFFVCKAAEEQSSGGWGTNFKKTAFKDMCLQMHIVSLSKHLYVYTVCILDAFFPLVRKMT